MSITTHSSEDQKNGGRETKYLEHAIEEFIKGKWPHGFRYNAQPLNKRMDVLEVKPDVISSGKSQSAHITIYNINDGSISATWSNIVFDRSHIKEIILSWLKAVETVHGLNCFDRHMPGNNNPEGQNWFVEITATD